MPASKMIVVEPITFGYFNIRIVGDTPLITNKYHPSKGQRIVNPETEYQECLHTIDNGNGEKIYAFPGSGIKKACVRTTNTHIKGMSKALVRGAFFVRDVLVPIIGSPPEPFTTPVGTSRSTIVNATRAIFREWQMDIRIKYLPTVISPEAITQIVNWTGTTIGLGSWSPLHDGSYGMFHVFTEEENG